MTTGAQGMGDAGSPESAVDRRIVPVGAVVLTTFFALLYALRGGIAAIDRGEDPRWAQQVVWSLAMWWTCLPLLPPLAALVRRFPVGRPRPWRNAGVLLLGTIAAAWLRHVVMSPVVVAITGVPDVAASAAARTLTYFTVFLVMVALLHAVHYYRAERAREVREAELARGLAEARLSALRTQLQPHFVFNVLNAVTTLVHADPMAADRMLTRFAALLRVILHEGTEGREEHALEREIDLLARYVELMQLRFGDRIVVEWAVADAARGARVPFLVLQPLVENAYEHGLGGRETGGRVRIGAARAGDRLQLVVEDDGSGLHGEAGSIIGRGDAGTGNGIGLRNTRDRLAQLYGARASLVLERPPGGGTRATVTLPFVDGPRGNGVPRP
jgi:two-component system LytT family sensor kinase